MDAINHLGHRLIENSVVKALASGTVAIINAIVTRIFPRDGEIRMTQLSPEKSYLREGWVSYTRKGELLPKWHKVTVCSRENRCNWEINYYSCPSGIEANRGLISIKDVKEGFPRLYLEGNELKLKGTSIRATRLENNSIITLATKKIGKPPECHSYLIAQGGHKHRESYGIAWKHFFFGRLFG